MKRDSSIIWISSALLFSLLLWAYTSTLDVASMSFGEVMPEGQTKRVQHLEGGIVQAIYVSEGQKIKAGEPLYELSPTLSDASLGETLAKEASLFFQMQRLLAQLQERDVFPDLTDERRDYQDYYSTEKELFQAQRVRFLTDVKVHELKIAQRTAEVSELESRRIGLVKRLELIQSQVKISNRLLKEQLVNEFEHLNLLKELTGVENELLHLKVSDEKLNQALAEARMSLQLTREKQKEDLQRELSEAKIALNGLNERLKSLQDSRSRTTIRAPVNGTILSLFYVTLGGVVPPGGTLLTMVPESESLLVSARLHIGDVGFVKPGQTARLSLMGNSLGGIVPIDGEVLQVSPDALTDPKTGPYYQVLIAPKAPYFGQSDKPYPLKPGLQIMVSILIGERSVLSYFTEPLIGDVNRMLSEQ